MDLSLPTPDNLPDKHEVSPQAVTERGRTISASEAEVKAALTLMVLNGGNAMRTAHQLQEEGSTISHDQLTRWRKFSFPRLYHQIRNERGKDIGQEIAGRAFERALQADEAAKVYLEKAIERLDEVPPEDLAKAAAAISTVMKNNVEKAQTLRLEPNHIEVVVDINEQIRQLESLGVAKRPEDAIDAQVVEESDA